MRDDRERLADILQAIGRIERYAARGREAFEAEELIQSWVVHHLEIIGEAARSVSPEMRAAHPDLPWGPISGMRNILVRNRSRCRLDSRRARPAALEDAVKAVLETIEPPPK